MRKIIVNAADLKTVAESLELDCATLAGIADEDDIDVVEYCADEIQHAASVLRNIINLSPEAPAEETTKAPTSESLKAPEKGVTIILDHSEDMITANADPAASAGESFRQGETKKGKFVDDKPAVNFCIGSGFSDGESFR